MIDTIPIDSDLFDLETKLRTMVSELVSPIMYKAAEQDFLIKKALKSNRKTKRKIQSFEVEVLKTLSTLVPTEHLNKKIEQINSDNLSSTNKLKNDIESAKSMIEKIFHDNSDLYSRLKNVEDHQKKIHESTDDNYRYIREFQDSLNLENSKFQASIKSSNNQQQIFNETVFEKINKLSVRITEINNKAIPEFTYLIEKRNFDIEELRSDIKVLQKERVSPGEFKQLKNKVESDMVKIEDRVEIKLNELYNYTEKILPVELSSDFTDTLLKVLDKRQIKRLVPIMESQLIDYNQLITMTKYNNEKKSFNKSLNSNLSTQAYNLDTIITELKQKIAKEEQEEQEKQERKFSKLSSMRRSDEVPLISKLKIQKAIILREEFKQPREISLNSSAELKNDTSSKPKITSIESDRENFEKNSLGSFDPQILDQIEKIYTDITQTNDNLNAINTKLTKAIEETQEQFKLAFSMLSEETKQLAKFKIQEFNEINSKIDAMQIQIAENADFVQEVAQKANKNREVLNKCTESGKIIYSLLLQDEEDRSSLQLTCYTENKPKTQIKQKKLATLKPECLSCNSQHSLVFSAFKMACLNYYPSEVNYNSNLYQRKSLIIKLGQILLTAWDRSDFSIVDETLKVSPVTDSSIIRAKSATKVKNGGRSILDASFTRMNFSSETPHRQRKS